MGGFFMAVQEKLVILPCTWHHFLLTPCKAFRMPIGMSWMELLLNANHNRCATNFSSLAFHHVLIFNIFKFANIFNIDTPCFVYQVWMCHLFYAKCQCCLCAIRAVYVQYLCRLKNTFYQTNRWQKVFTKSCAAVWSYVMNEYFMKEHLISSHVSLGVNASIAWYLPS